MFRALETVDNDKFGRIIESENQKWLATSKNNPFDVDALLSIAVNVYNNISADNKWLTTANKQDTIIALTTKLNNLEKKLAQTNLLNREGNSNNYNNRNGGPNSSNNRYADIQDWRKKKGAEERVERDGKTWYWCPYHKVPSEGFPDGLYVTHNHHNGGFRVKQRREAHHRKE